MKACHWVILTDTYSTVREYGQFFYWGKELTEICKREYSCIDLKNKLRNNLMIPLELIYVGPTKWVIMRRFGWINNQT